MKNYDLAPDEVILYEAEVSFDEDDELHLTLTSKKMIFEKTTTKGFIKTKTETKVVDMIILDNIKIHNGKVQAQQKGDSVFVQTVEKNFTITFENRLEAMKFVTKVVDVVTGTSMSDRGAEKIKGAINKVDDVLGFDTRDTIKGVIENGVTGTLLKGIKKKK